MPSVLFLAAPILPGFAWQWKTCGFRGAYKHKMYCVQAETGLHFFAVYPRARSQIQMAAASCASNIAGIPSTNFRCLVL